MENIASLGAKVIVLDYMFDSPDLSTTRERKVRNDLLEGQYSTEQEKKNMRKKEQEYINNLQEDIII